MKKRNTTSTDKTSSNLVFLHILNEITALETKTHRFPLICELRPRVKSLKNQVLLLCTPFEAWRS